MLFCNTHFTRLKDPLAITLNLFHTNIENVYNPIEGMDKK